MLAIDLLLKENGFKRGAKRKDGSYTHRKRVTNFTNGSRFYVDVVIGDTNLVVTVYRINDDKTLSGIADRTATLNQDDAINAATAAVTLAHRLAG